MVKSSRPRRNSSIDTIKIKNKPQLINKKKKKMDASLINAATENFNLPHDIVVLPTGGIFYKSKKKSIKVGYLTASDENYLLSGLGTKDNIVMTLLRNKIYEHELRPEELLDEDIQAILIFLRNTAFGPEYKLMTEDPKTNKQFEIVINLGELNVKKVNVTPNQDGTFTTKLPVSGSLVKLRPLSFGEIFEVEQIADSYPKGRVAPKVTMKLQRNIVELDGDTDLSKIALFVEKLPIGDSKFIRNFLKENVPSLDLKQQILTPSGDKIDVDIVFGVEFFRPFF